ncbi:MAG TPA: hypothetical protein VFI47_02765 [Acidimicrobiales bacterium]|nr:hypothetical protein [Acidimicrobiales bacterium]
MHDRAIDDDRLLDLIGQVIDETDPVPADALAVARAADIGSTDAELAELTFDSLHDERSLTLRDADTAVRSLGFAAADTTIELDIADDILVGRVAPPVEADLHLEQASGVHTVRTDALGRFRAPVAAGPLRLRLAGPGGATATPWIVR